MKQYKTSVPLLVIICTLYMNPLLCMYRQGVTAVKQGKLPPTKTLRKPIKVLPTTTTQTTTTTQQTPSSVQQQLSKYPGTTAPISQAFGPEKERTVLKIEAAELPKEETKKTEPEITEPKITEPAKEEAKQTTLSKKVEPPADKTQLPIIIDELNQAPELYKKGFSPVFTSKKAASELIQKNPDASELFKPINEIKNPEGDTICTLKEIPGGDFLLELRTKANKPTAYMVVGTGESANEISDNLSSKIIHSLKKTSPGLLIQDVEDLLSTALENTEAKKTERKEKALQEAQKKAELEAAAEQVEIEKELEKTLKELEEEAETVVAIEEQKELTALNESIAGHLEQYDSKIAAQNHIIESLVQETEQLQQQLAEQEATGKEQLEQKKAELEAKREEAAQKKASLEQEKEELQTQLDQKKEEIKKQKEQELKAITEIYEADITETIEQEEGLLQQEITTQENSLAQKKAERLAQIEAGIETEDPELQEMQLQLDALKQQQEIAHQKRLQYEEAVKAQAQLIGAEKTITKEEQPFVTPAETIPEEEIPATPEIPQKEKEIPEGGGEGNLTEQEELEPIEKPIIAEEQLAQQEKAPTIPLFKEFETSTKPTVTMIQLPQKPLLKEEQKIMEPTPETSPTIPLESLSTESKGIRNIELGRPTTPEKITGLSDGQQGVPRPGKKPFKSKEKEQLEERARMRRSLNSSPSGRYQEESKPSATGKRGYRGGVTSEEEKFHIPYTQMKMTRGAQAPEPEKIIVPEITPEATIEEEIPEEAVVEKTYGKRKFTDKIKEVPQEKPLEVGWIQKIWNIIVDTFNYIINSIRSLFNVQ